MSKMYIMKGLPASGKSTIAQGMIIDHGNTVRINKDLLRKMLHFNKFTGKNEGLTRDAARALAKAFLTNNINVIIDDTNLNEGTMQSWKDFAKELDVTHEVVDLTDVPVEECVLRDTDRQESVGGVVIKNMALKAGLKTFAQKSVVLCDIDGTIADTTHRLHYVNKEAHDKWVEAMKPEDRPTEEWKKDWKGFFSEMEMDPVRKDIQAMLIALYNEGYTIIFMSARPENYREATLRWLQAHFLTFAYTLIMRREGDKRPDTEAKKDMLEQHFPDKGVIHTIFDDRPSVIRLWKEMGLNVVDVGKGEEF